MTSPESKSETDLPTTLTAVETILSGGGPNSGLARPWPFLGPAFIASIAYVDPGNFANNIQARPVRLPALMKGRHMTLNILYSITGLALLTLGRRLFWLFVAAMGMAAGLQAAQQHTIFQPYWMVLLVGLAAAIAGALLAIFFQRVAVAVAGLAAGATVTAHMMGMLGFVPMPLITLAGAVAGAIVLYLLFDWGLIALSSLAGAALIAQAWPIAANHQSLLFQILALVGILIQSGLFIRQKKKAASRFKA